MIGIGVNVALRPEDLPPALRDGVTSVALEGGARRTWGAWPPRSWAAWPSGIMPARGATPPRVLAAWLRRSLPWWGRPVEARAGDTVLRGMARGLDECGASSLEQEGGVLTGAPLGRGSGGAASVRDPCMTTLLLTIDAGNTNTVLGVHEGDDLKAHWRLTTRREQTADEYGILVRNLFAASGIDPSADRGRGPGQRGAAADVRCWWRCRGSTSARSRWWWSRA